ncbi:MAG: hypothetical protein K1X38_14785 [Microthrixaceae bacterium]|nr:hypothetical protein [Microthrixaceae bacterium]
MFGRGLDGALIHAWFDGTWHEWESLGGGIVGQPATSSWAPGGLDVHVRGTDGGDYHRWYGENGWSEWERLGGWQMAGDPTIVTWGSPHAETFARGLDGRLIHMWFDGTRWQEWEAL